MVKRGRKPNNLVLKCYLNTEHISIQMSGIITPTVFEYRTCPGIEWLLYILTFRPYVPELLEWLELVDELINDLPEPLVGQVQDYRLVGTENAVEQVAVVVIRLEPEQKNYWFC